MGGRGHRRQTAHHQRETNLCPLHKSQRVLAGSAGESLRQVGTGTDAVAHVSGTSCVPVLVVKGVSSAFQGVRVLRRHERRLSFRGLDGLHGRRSSVRGPVRPSEKHVAADVQGCTGQSTDVLWHKAGGEYAVRRPLQARRRCSHW